MSRLGQLTTTALLLASYYGTRGALAAADDPIRFLYPDEEGLEFHYLDRVQVSYLSNFTAPYLYIWCGQGNAKQQQMDRPDANNATTEITLKFESNQDLENDCWFNLRIHDLTNSSPLGANSPAFTYLHATRAGGPATLGLPTATATSVSISTPTASSVTNGTANGTDTDTATSSTTAAASSGLSTGAKAGIGVGVAVGAIGVAAAAGAFLFRRRKRAKSEKHGMGRTDTRDVGGRPSSPGMYPASELQGHEHASEMSGGGLAAYKGKYAPVAPGSPQEMPADHAVPEIERHELPAGLDGRDEGKFRP